MASNYFRLLQVLSDIAASIEVTMEETDANIMRHIPEDGTLVGKLTPIGPLPSTKGPEEDPQPGPSHLAGKQVTAQEETGDPDPIPMPAVAAPKAASIAAMDDGPPMKIKSRKVPPTKEPQAGQRSKMARFNDKSPTPEKTPSYYSDKEDEGEGPKTPSVDSNAASGCPSEVTDDSSNSVYSLTPERDPKSPSRSVSEEPESPQAKLNRQAKIAQKIRNYQLQGQARRAEMRQKIQKQMDNGMVHFFGGPGPKDLPLCLPQGRDTLNQDLWETTGLTSNEAYTYIIGLARGAHPLSFDHMVRSGVPAGAAARQLLARIPGNMLHF
jgi:hypothetical protein